MKNPADPADRFPGLTAALRVFGMSLEQRRAVLAAAAADVDATNGGSLPRSATADQRAPYRYGAEDQEAAERLDPEVQASWAQAYESLETR